MKTTETQTQIDKDKEAVAKMIGAKSAMEAALRRIDTLETALKRCETLHVEAMKGTTDAACIFTHYSGQNCAYTDSKKPVCLDDFSKVIAEIVRSVLK